MSVGSPLVHVKVERERGDLIVGIGGLLSVASAFGALLVLLSTQSRYAPGEAARTALRDVNAHDAVLWIAVGLRVLTVATAALVCVHLLRRSAGRRSLDRGRATLAVAGSVVLIGALVCSQVVMVDAAHTFVAGDVLTDDRAEHLLTETRSQQAAAIITTFGGLLFAYAIGWAALTAARVGLTSKFLGYFGVGAAVVSALIPVAGQGLVAGWLASIGAVLLGWFSGGMGPAWQDATRGEG